MLTEVRRNAMNYSVQLAFKQYSVHDDTKLKCTFFNFGLKHWCYIACIQWIDKTICYQLYGCGWFTSCTLWHHLTHAYFVKEICFFNLHNCLCILQDKMSKLYFSQLNASALQYPACSKRNFSHILRLSCIIILQSKSSLSSLSDMDIGYAKIRSHIKLHHHIKHRGPDIKLICRAN